MVTTVIHRVVEQHAATRPRAIAVADGSRELTYRALNHAANACARTLMAHGFRRGSHAIVCMEPGARLAILLLAILKAGGSYTWEDGRRTDGAATDVLSIAPAGRRSGHYIAVDPVAIIEHTAPSPNLPVMTRGSDVACVIGELLVPHATVVSMHAAPAISPSTFGAEAGAVDLWGALMAGVTAIPTVEESVVAA